MNVLALFDGMSCGRLALDRAGIKVDKYYASEIDKYAIQVSQKNYPDTIQLGDIKNWNNWKLPKIDLILGGSPCQGFSMAGQHLNFEDERSKLFFEFVKCIKHFKPRYFLLENVKMKKEFQDIISDLLGVQPIEINSALLSAQSRKRLYWTNIPDVTQPKDKNIYLKDILEDDSITDRDKSYCIDANYHKGANYEQYKNKHRRQLVGTNRCIQVGEANLRGHDSIKRVYSPEGKSPCLTTMGGGHREPKVSVIRDKSKSIRAGGRLSYDRHEWDSADELHWRKLTPLECERLQTVPDNYTEGVSNTQRYKMLGNGWTVDVIAHIIQSIKR